MLVCGSGLTTVAWISSVCGHPALTVPTRPEAGRGVVGPLAGRRRHERQPGRQQVGHLDVGGRSGPLLVRVTVKVIVSPTLGVGLLTVLVNARSACCGVSVTLAVLLPGLGSNWSAWLIVAVLVCGSGLTTVAWISSVWGVPTLTVPTVHTPVARS